MLTMNSFSSPRFLRSAALTGGAAVALLAALCAQPADAAEGLDIRRLQPALAQPKGGQAANLQRVRVLQGLKTLGQYHLVAVVQKDGSVFLRWSNSVGEMPTKGVIISRRREGETAWEDLNKTPIGFFLGKDVDALLAHMDPEKREQLMSFFYGEMQEGTGEDKPDESLSDAQQAEADRQKAARLTPAAVRAHYEEQRKAGKVEVDQMNLLQVAADVGKGAAEVLGLQYIDKPGAGRFQYRISVQLPEGGVSVAEFAQTLDTSVPTAVPVVGKLVAESGNGCVYIDWEAPASDLVTHYNVYRAEGPGGDFRKINDKPVKKVHVEVEDPELVARRGLQQAAIIDREAAKVPMPALTRAKLVQINRAAEREASESTNLPQLAPAQSRQIREAVKAGRLLGAGIFKPKATYTDSIRDKTNSGFFNERAYTYKVTSVDIAGGETELSAAPTVSGTPRDREAPGVPTRPALEAQRIAVEKFIKARQLRLAEPGMQQLNAAIQAKLPKEPLSPAVQAQVRDAVSAPAGAAASGLSAGSAKVANAALAKTVQLKPEFAALSLESARKLRLSRSVAFISPKDMEEVAKAAELFSKSDGSAPEARLVWSKVSDTDLKEYIVYRAEGKGAWVKLGSAQIPSFVDSSLKVGVAYRYAVSSIDVLGNESAKSAEGVVEVRDSALASKLALTGGKGEGLTKAPASLPERSFLRPSGRVLEALKVEQLGKAGLLQVKPVVRAAGLAPVAMKPVAGLSAQRLKVSSTSLRGIAKVPEPEEGAAKPASSGSVLHAASLLKEIEPAEAESLKALPDLSLARKAVKLSFNPMLLEAVAKPAEVFAVIEWDKPAVGVPVDYIIYQAPTKVEMVSTKREAVTRLATPLSLDLGAAKTVAGARGGNAGAASNAGARAASATRKASASHSDAAAPALLARPFKVDAAVNVESSTALHALAGKGLALTPRKGIDFTAKARRDFVLLAKPVEGPGEFSLISEKPVSGQRYVVRFPAEIAQYGGATYYYRVQPRGREFEHQVAGPLSEIIKVVLPDIVPPPVPVVGSADLRVAESDKLQVQVSWTQKSVPDLAGFHVDRQRMNYRTEEGEVIVTGAAEKAVRLTSSPITTGSYTDSSAIGGLFRYTIRSIDKTGNLSEARGELDVLVPTEPMPGAPQQVAWSGDKLTWKAGEHAQGYTVWRSFTGNDGDFECVSPILKAGDTSFSVPSAMKGHFRVMARSVSGMLQTPSTALVR